MRDTLNHLATGPLDVGWKVLTALTVLSVLDMTRTLLRRIRHLSP